MAWPGLALRLFRRGREQQAERQQQQAGAGAEVVERVESFPVESVRDGLSGTGTLMISDLQMIDHHDGIHAGLGLGRPSQ